MLLALTLAVAIALPPVLILIGLGYVASEVAPHMSNATWTLLALTAGVGGSGGIIIRSWMKVKREDGQDR
ncbi:hypothetical protein [Phytohabitans houttuyneae]|nr:hypothetical protein [Phytohabitans houttuyneae]